MDEDLQAHHAEMAKSINMFMKNVHSPEDLDDSFWDSSNTLDAGLSSVRFESQDILAARRGSDMISGNIERYSNDKKQSNNKFITVALVWISVILLLSTASFYVWTLTQGNRITIKRETPIGNSNYIPLFLNIPGTGASVIPSALSSCLNFKEAEQVHDIKNVSYYNIHYNSHQ